MSCVDPSEGKTKQRVRPRHIVAGFVVSLLTIVAVWLIAYGVYAYTTRRGLQGDYIDACLKYRELNSVSEELEAGHAKEAREWLDVVLHGLEVTIEGYKPICSQSVRAQGEQILRGHRAPRHTEIPSMTPDRPQKESS